MTFEPALDLFSRLSSPAPRSPRARQHKTFDAGDGLPVSPKLTDNTRQKNQASTERDGLVTLPVNSPRREGGAAGLHVAGPYALLFEVLLVIILGPVKRAGGQNLGDDGPPEDTLLFQGSLGIAGLLLLLGIVEEDGGTVLGADVGSLAVHGGWIVALPESGQQLQIGDLVRVEFHVDGFRVAGGTGADFFIGRIELGTAGITDRG